MWFNTVQLLLAAVLLLQTCNATGDITVQQRFSDRFSGTQRRVHIQPNPGTPVQWHKLVVSEWGPKGIRGCITETDSCINTWLFEWGLDFSIFTTKSYLSLEQSWFEVACFYNTALCQQPSVGPKFEKRCTMIQYSIAREEMRGRMRFIAMVENVSNALTCSWLGVTKCHHELE